MNSKDISQELTVALTNAAIKVVLDAVIAQLSKMDKGATVDDAIAALHASRLKSWEDFKKAAGPLTPT